MAVNIYRREHYHLVLKKDSTLDSEQYQLIGLFLQMSVHFSINRHFITFQIIRFHSNHTKLSAAECFDICRNPGLNQGPLDLQSNALPTELFRLTKAYVESSLRFLDCIMYS